MSAVRNPSRLDALRDSVFRQAGALVGGGLLLLALWLAPDLAPAGLGGSSVELAHGRVVALPAPGTDPMESSARVLILEGPRAGEVLEAALQGPVGQVELPDYRVGQEVVVTISRDLDGEFVTVSDRWRIPALAGVVGLFGLSVVLVGGWRGVRSLLALALTLGAVVKILLPLVLAGWSPILLAVLISAAVTLATLLLTEGVRRTTAAAVLGTFGALGLTALLVVWSADLAQFTDVQGGADLFFVQAVGGSEIDLRGLVFAAIVLGALGVIDDVTITQAATVHELHRVDPSAPPSDLFRRAMNVGRSHIAATVNTLVLAYVGASLPLLVLFAAGRQPVLAVASGEMVAVEIVRAVVGGIGIVAAVPLTTAVAALIAPARPR